MPKPGRLYVPLDVNFFDDPQIAGLDYEAQILFLAMLCLAKRTTTDGVVTLKQIRRLVPEVWSENPLAALCDGHLVEAGIEANTYRIVSWNDWNEEAASIKERSTAKQEAGRKGGITSGLVRRARSKIEAEAKQPEASDEAAASGLLEHRVRVEKEKSKELKASSPSVTEDPLLGFDKFWGTYPERNGKRLGRRLCEARWKKLSLAEKRTAFKGAANYGKAVEGDLTIAKDPDRWLRDRCWEDWQEPADSVLRGSPVVDNRPRVRNTADPDSFVPAALAAPMPENLRALIPNRASNGS